MIGKNNPFNVRYSVLNRWKGLDKRNPSTKGFCNFNTEYFGVRSAMYLLYRSYRRKNIRTISEMINRYAPPSENKTWRYVNYVCSHCGLLPFDSPKTTNDWINVFYAMALYEGNPIPKSKIQEYFYQFISE